ncbi:hypothetical protein [Sulfurospirillum diekertiae]|uniref:Uncharacterized protein n=1 Tax=Sulfurospirillum diekertiae TaxID=1854492 RepID=A0A1Y0HN29_9BACT|nr:hypothetical protein [Sulfurospirillum diekertiae]ARU49537.1 hypothetical protein Sdiek1_2387 [Sulfurospirillum diekertiae]ASC94340.1 hypothetical protein Sdiek2_2334 [Sulfurospirillum diekertiae]
MNKLFLGLFYAFCGLLLAISVNLIISTNVWLEMRIHERLVLEVCMGLGMVFSFFRNSASIALFLVLQSMMFLICFWLSKMDLIYYSLRNFYLDGISISTIKIVFLTFLTLINLLIVYHLLGKKLTGFSKFS